MSKIAIERARCQMHKKYSDYACGNGTCNKPIIMCQQCLPMHQKHEVAVYKLVEMVNKVKNNVQLLRKSTAQAKQKHVLLQNLTKDIQKQAKLREGSGIRALMQLIQQQKKQIGQLKKQLHKKAQEILKQKTDIQYLSQLKQKNLLMVKIKVSSQKGLDKMRNKIQDVKNPVTKIESLKQSVVQFHKLKSSYQELMKNSMTSKIQEFLKFQMTKRSTLKKTQKTNCSENASKHKRSRSQTNIKAK